MATAKQEINDSSLFWRQKYGGIFTREWLPEETPRGGFFCLHGMESHSGWFNDLALQLNALGWAVTACDRPGWGKSPGPAGHLASYRDVLARTGSLAQKVRGKFGSAHLVGMSWGGLAALYFGLRCGWMVDSLGLLAPGLATRESLPLTQKVKTAYALFNGDLRATFESEFSPAVFSDDRDIQEYIAADSHRLKKVSASFCLETVKMRAFIKQNAGKRKLPGALCLLAQNDRMIDSAAVEDICRRAGAAVEVVPDSTHVLALEKPEEVARRLSENAERAEAARRGARSRVWVVGGGSVGGLVGSLLSFAGHEVGVLVKPRQLQEQNGGDYTLSNLDCWRTTDSRLKAVASTEDLPSDPALVVLAVKSFDTALALQSLRGHVPPSAVLMSLQNGLSNEEAVVRVFPEHAAAAGVICTSLELTAPGSVLWPDDRGGMAAAAYAGDADRIRETVLGILPDTGMECDWIDGPEAAQRLKWSKLMLNIAFNALNSVTGLSSGAILRDERYSELAISALREGFAVMDRLQLRPVDLPGFMVQKLRLVVKGPRALAEKLLAWQASRSVETAFSMRQDIQNRRQRTEIDELNGAVVRYGDELGVDVEANRELCRLVQEIMPAN